MGANKYQEMLGFGERISIYIIYLFYILSTPINMHDAEGEATNLLACIRLLQITHPTTSWWSKSRVYN